MKQQLYKLSLLLLLFSLISCIDKDEEVISTQDLLLGKWKITDQKVNNQIQSLTTCEYQETLEITATEIIFTDFLFDDATTNCILNNESSYPFTFIEDNKFKIYQNENLINIEIIDLNTDTLMLKYLIDNESIVEETTYKRVE